MVLLIIVFSPEPSINVIVTSDNLLLSIMLYLLEHHMKIPLELDFVLLSKLLPIMVLLSQPNSKKISAPKPKSILLLLLLFEKLLKDIVLLLERHKK